MRIVGSLILLIGLLALPISCSQTTSVSSGYGERVENMGLIAQRSMCVEVSCFVILAAFLLIGLGNIEEAILSTRGDACPYCGNTIRHGSKACPACKKPVYWHKDRPITKENAEWVRNQESHARKEREESHQRFIKETAKMYAGFKNLFRGKKKGEPPKPTDSSSFPPEWGK